MNQKQLKDINDPPNQRNSSSNISNNIFPSPPISSIGSFHSSDSPNDYSNHTRNKHDISNTNEHDIGNTNIKISKPSPSNKYGKCSFCNKKLKIINFTCKCELKFCIIHNNPHSHNCQYDSKKAKKNYIIESNPKLGSKFHKIE